MFLIAFGIIKLIFKPIKTSIALLLTLPSISTCEIVLLIYKFFRNASYGTGGTFNVYTSPTYSGNNLANFELNEAEKLKPKKTASSHTDNFGKTTYTDSTENENITTSNTNYDGEETFDDGTSTSSDSFGNKYYH